MIEQAVFGSAQTHRTEGYHLLRRTAGLADIDARDLVAWCPTHDSLLRGSAPATSVNFHRLSNGGYCISRSRPASSEYSCRGGQHVMTHCLVVPTDVLLRFSNNPFAVLRAATALGAITDHDSVPERLEPINLRGRAASVDVGLIENFRQAHSLNLPLQLLSLLTSVPKIGWVGGVPGEPLMAVLFNLLPVSARPEISFSTGLTYSPCRPFRLQLLPDDRAELRRFMRQANVAVVEDGAPQAGRPPETRWAQFVDELARKNALDWLANELAQSRHARRALADLENLASELQAKFHIMQAQKSAAPATDRAAPAAKRAALRSELQPDPADGRGADSDHRRDDAAHRRHVQRAASAVGRPAPGRATAGAANKANPLDPKIMEVLEHLDEAVYAAIGGDAAALDKVSVLWPLVQDELSPTLLEESRENYLRHALATWAVQESESTRSPDRAASALDVLCLLFEH